MIRVRIFCIFVQIWLFAIAEDRKDFQNEVQDLNCGEWIRWPWWGCPHGDRWACWTSQEERDDKCSGNGPWGSGPWPSFPPLRYNGNGRMRYHWICHCCGLCPLPDDEALLRTLPYIHRLVARLYYRDNLKGDFERGKKPHKNAYNRNRGSMVYLEPVNCHL